MRVGVNVTRRWISSWRHAIREKDSSVNAFVSTSKPAPSGPENLPLRDVAIAVKDMICTSDMPTSSSSAMLKGYFLLSNAFVVVNVLQTSSRHLTPRLWPYFGMQAQTSSGK